MAQLKSKPDTRTDKQKQEAFLMRLEEYGNVSRSSRLAKVPRRTIYNWLDPENKEHEEFQKQYKISLKIGVGGLEDEAKRRAYEGVRKNVLYKGKKVDTVREYSDTLLIVLLKAHEPEKYKDRVQHGGDPDKPIQHNHEITTTVVQFRDMTQPTEKT